MKILILYFSKTGHTLEAVKATAEGIRAASSDADTVEVSDFEAAAVADYEGIILASPCWSGSVSPWGVALPVLRALARLQPDSLKGKRCGGISVHSMTGGQTTVKHLGKLLFKKGCEDYRSGPAAKAGVPFSLWKGPSVGAQDEERFKNYGTEFVAWYGKLQTRDLKGQPLTSDKVQKGPDLNS
jgi:flavodoxin